MAYRSSICSWFLLICIGTHSQWILAQFVNVSTVDNQTVSNISTISIDTNTSNQTSVVLEDDNHHYILLLKLNLKEDSIIPYVRDEIYYHGYAYNITTEDLIDLSNAREIGLNETYEKLGTLNISTDVFTVTSFKLLLNFVNMTFGDFYDKLKTGSNLTGTPLLEAFHALNIDPANFSHAVTYGQQDSVYDVLSKGIYSRENFQIATAKVGSDSDTFYRKVKDIILDQIQTKSLSYYQEKLSGILPWVSKDLYDDLWTSLNISIFDVYLVPNARKIINDLYTRLDENITLGVATSFHEIIVHRKIYERLEKFLKLVSINAVVVVSPRIFYENLTLVPLKNSNSGTLWSNSSIASSIGKTQEKISTNDQNCTYITIKSTQVNENQVKIWNNSHSTIVVETENGTEFNLGNPLICRGKLVGLAASRNEKNNLFTFDTFYQASKEVPTSGFHENNVIPIVFLHLIFLFALRLVH